MAPISTHALDEGWVLDDVAAPQPKRRAPTLTLVADAPDELPDIALDRASPTAVSVDDGWCVDDGWTLDASSAVTAAPEPAPGLTLVADSFDDYPDVEPQAAHDGWFVEADERAPTMELSEAEQAFFSSGEQLATLALAAESFEDLAPGPAPSFWQRLLRRNR